MHPISFNQAWLFVSIAITVLLLWLEHWFPYPFKAHVMFNYTLGVSAILVGITVYCITQNMVVNIVIVWTFSIVGGVAVGLAYLIDKGIALLWILRDWLRDERKRQSHH